jgi:lysophospholipase L1-like esterase
VQHQYPNWIRYAALGDSFTEGLDDEVGPDGRHRGWADLLALSLAERACSRGEAGIEYANLAIRGRLVEQVVREQVPAAVRLRPDLVSLAVGVNDSLRRRFDLDALATNLDSGVRDLRAGGADVLLFAFGDPSRRSSVMGLIRDRIRAYNTVVDAIAQVYGCYVVHFWDVAAMDDDRLWSADRLHLSPRGHLLAAECVEEALGIGGSDWRTPIVPEARPGIHRRVAGDARWVRGHLAPWVARRARGRSSGEGVVPKNASWVRVEAGRWVAPTPVDK